MDSRAEAYHKQLDALTRQATAMSPEARERIRKLLDEANREILADVARSTPGSYNAARLQALKAQVERVMEEFRQQATSQVQAQEQQSYEQAAKSVDATVAAGTGTLVVTPVIDRAVLQVVQGYSADLIAGLTHDSAAQINAAIQRGFLGQLNLTQLVTQIGTAMDGDKFSGLFGPLGNRAMTIATNEIGRVQSLASMARIHDLKERHPKLKKRWLHTPVALVPRPSHEWADGQVREPDAPFLIDGEELQYPRDPSGSAGNTINCHCLVQPYLDDAELQSTAGERGLLASYGISVTAA